MTNPVPAYLTQHSDGSWGLWVSPGAAEGAPLVRSDLFAATAPGIVPSLTARQDALAQLGVVPTESTWTWREWNTDGPTIPAGSGSLVGSIPVQPAVQVRPGPRGAPMTVRTERRDQPKHNRGPVLAIDLGTVLGPEAVGWPALGLTVHYGGVIDRDGTQFQVFAGDRLIGFTMASSHAPGGREYRAVVYTDREGLPYGSVVPGGLPEDPLRAKFDALREFYKPGDREYPAGPYVVPGEGR
ncbi:hypothetical protein ABTY59_33755 [Streptomyces sp. NPDC096079]|uniref:DUF6303 family protein n=1 Tax=Streptomyces sp. NPDC096079 TaxID=3155820 RepID=UPI00331881A7